MEAEQKKKIIKKYLEETINRSIDFEDDDLFYIELANAIDGLEGDYGQIIDFEQVLTDDVEWKKLADIFDYGIIIDASTPDLAMGIHSDRLQAMASDKGLPRADYYSRTTATNPGAQTNINDLIESSRTKLAGLLKDNLPELEDFDAANTTQVENLVTSLKNQKKQAKKVNNDEEVQKLKKYLTVAKDLHKVNELRAITIPSENGDDYDYCTLAEEAGGVTEKVSLISLDTVTEKLDGLVERAINSIDDYIDNHKVFKLGMEGILKLPKHGNINEVQRESMALNVSRILGQDTTQSSIVSYEGKPALFVPFDNIKLMSEFASGKEFKAFGFTSKTYEHYSTINTVGSGLQSDQYIDDFGDSLGLFYLCSDTDSIGGYNQNKALRNNKNLYIFDQVIMSTDKLKLDSRLSLQPSEFIMKHTRHGQGRNRTLIEDSSLERKFDSLMDLRSKQQRIIKYATSVADTHQREINRLDEQLKKDELSVEEIKELELQKTQVSQLKVDAIIIKNTMSKRISKISSALPMIKKGQQDGISLEHIKKGLVLEKLLHNPTTFTDDGRPYKNSWTYRHNNPVQTMELQNNDKILRNYSPL